MIAHPQIVFGLLMGAVAALVSVIFWVIPNWSRQEIFFAVTVAPRFRDSSEAAHILRGYRVQALAHVAISFALILLGTLEQRALPLILGILWLVFGPLVAMARAHKKVLPHAVAHSTIREASLEPRSIQLPGGWLLQFGPLAMLAIVAIYLSLHGCFHSILVSLHHIRHFS